MEALLYFVLVAVLFAVMMRFGCGAHVLGEPDATLAPSMPMNIQNVTSMVLFAWAAIVPRSGVALRIIA